MFLLDTNVIFDSLREVYDVEIDGVEIDVVDIARPGGGVRRVCVPAG